MSGEVITFRHMFGVDVSLLEEMDTILGLFVPVKFFTDRKNVSDVILKGSRTSKKYIMLHMTSARE